MLYIFITTCIGLICFQNWQIHAYKKSKKCEESLVAEISHDLKSPTSAQIHMLNLLLQGHFGKLNPEQQKMIELTRNSEKYMSNLITNILSSYKINCGKLFLKKTEFDVIAIIHSICQEFKYLAQEKQQTIIFNSEFNKCCIYADPIQIHRVISNLISNALTYGFEKSLIVIDLIQNEKYTELSIMNKSNALSEQEMKNIFNKFSKTKNSNYNKSSSGLGLYNIKKIIKLHQGKISAKCTPDGIFTFEFKIPARHKPNIKKSPLKFT